MDIHSVAPECHDVRLGAYLFIFHNSPGDKELTILLYHAEINLLSYQILNTKVDGISLLEFSSNLDEFSLNLS